MFGTAADESSTTVTSTNYLPSNSVYSLNMAGSETGSDTTMSDQSLPQTYQLKTMCLAKKTAQMPTKEEHGFLLFCGLGARKWECDMNCNSLTFKQAILNIYPRLRSVIGYNLYTVSKDKKHFERIPEKVNTPKRIRSYLGPLFTGCLIIVPVSDIVLMEEKREHLRQIDVRQTQLPAQRPAPAPEPAEAARHRSLCLICGKCEKTPGTGSFYRILEETIDCYGGGGETIVKKLTDILGFNFESKRKFLASLEICKKCLRTTTEVVRMEEQLKKSKEELVSNFFTTTSKFKKNQGSQSEECKSPPGPPPLAPTPTYPTYPAAAGFPGFPGHHNPAAPQFLVQPMAFLNQHKHLQYGNGIVQFYQPQPYPAIRPNPSRQARSAGNGSPPTSHAGPDTDKRTEAESGGGKSAEVGSEATPSEVGSSCYMSVSPLPKRPARDEAEEESCCSPRPFDTQSYASTFSFRSSSSIRSKAEIKQYDQVSYDEPISLEIEPKEQQSGEKLELAEKRKCESNDTSPRSQTSPVSTSSPKPDSLVSQSPSPDLDKQREMMKPWKKRKIVHESGDSQGSQGDNTPEPGPKEAGQTTTPTPSQSAATSGGDESPDCQQALDQGGNSDS